MGINKAEQSMNDRLVRRILDLEKTMRELKSSPQPIGADILKVGSVPNTYLVAGPVTVAAGSSINFILTCTPSSEILTIWNFLFTPYIDTVFIDDNYQYPTGASLTSAMKDLDMQSWMDWADSSDTTNVRVFKIRITNNDASSHNYMIAIRAYLPVLGGTSGS